MIDKRINILFLALLFYFGGIVQNAKSENATLGELVWSVSILADLTLPSPSEHWIVYAEEQGKEFSLIDDVKNVGRVKSIADRKIITDPTSVEEIILAPGMAIAFFPPIVPEKIEEFCQSIQRSIDEHDRIILCNGDEIVGNFLRMDARRVYFCAYDRELVFPRYRVRVLSIGVPVEK